MTSGNGFGVNEEHVAASFRFIVKPSSGKTRQDKTNCVTLYRKINFLKSKVVCLPTLLLVQ